MHDVLMGGPAIGLLLAIGSSVAASAGAQTAAPDAMSLLRKKNAVVNWDARSRVVADVSCDGVPDTAVVGYGKDAVWLGVVFGAKAGSSHEPTMMRFAVGGNSQASFCATPVKLGASPIACQSEDGPLPGCRPAKGCSALSLADESCDAFHFYWDSTKKSLTWWRR